MFLRGGAQRLRRSSPKRLSEGSTPFTPAKKLSDIYCLRAFILFNQVPLPLIDCGISDVRFLQFDHIRGNKKDSIARMIGTATSWKTIEDEIAKCEVRCANCHSAKTSERGGWWRHLI